MNDIYDICSKCGIQKLADTFKFSYDDFIERATKVTFWQTPNKHWAGQRCSKCSFGDCLFFQCSTCRVCT